MDDDQDFITEAAGLLARCSDEQRSRLAGMIQRYGKTVSGTEEKSSGLASDASLTGKSIDEMFPDLKRLHG